ncbi:hypothetical protein DL762_001753 [Monosporascus cannonballus]|uniref:Uncharacterized protein n=1 Tax=Monosporascus cannonballus TaxID=155416 RepID=A0ABY0HFL0_9PEZI|nr:hypothetical protein DL762_001753 [Monosporascus cannonballus]
MWDIVNWQALFLLFFSPLVSCIADSFPNQVQELHVEYVRAPRGYTLLPRFTNSTTSSSTTSSTDAPPPLTTFPPPTAVSTSEVTSVTTNTHTNIDGTEVPVLHGCSFCPSGSDSGLILFGIPDVPGVYPPPPNPPLPGFPTITIGNDGNPTEDDGPTTTTSSTSTTSTSTTTSGTTPSSSSEAPTSTMVEVVWEDWGNTEESPSEDDEAADYAQSQIDAAFGSSRVTTSSSASTSSASTSSASTSSASTSLVSTSSVTTSSASNSSATPSPSSTTSSVPTTLPTSTTTQHTPTPTTPLERGPIICHNEADFPGHADINPGAQDEFSTDFSGLDDVDEYLGPGSPAIELNTKDGDGVSYQYSASWIEGCVTSVDKQSYRFPLGSPSQITAYLLVREAFTKCDNGGVGGKSQAGCLMFEFTGGR